MGDRVTRLILFFFFVLIFFNVSSPVLADSGYVLPYPSAMPGSRIYFFHKLEEKLGKYWYFGDYGSFTYNRQLTDKYLVEAKTLFEYKQYLLALHSLSVSNYYFRGMVHALRETSVTKPGRKEKILLMKQAAEKHREILAALAKNLPSDFVWQPEKSASLHLNIAHELNSALEIRKKI